VAPLRFSRTTYRLLGTLIALMNPSCEQPSYADVSDAAPASAPPNDASTLPALPNDAGALPNDAGTPPAQANDAGSLTARANDAGTLPAQANDAGTLPVQASDPGPGAADDAGSSAQAGGGTEAAMTPPPPVQACADCDPGFAPGRYAVLARFYGSAAATGGGWFAEESVAMVDVRPVPGSSSLTMDWETCAYRGQLTVPLIPLISYSVLSPQKFPRRTFALTVAGKSFEATGETALVGYEALQASTCPGGSSQTHVDRSWLFSGQCTCASSELPPTAVDDCRVIDSDEDGKPGFTVQFTGGAENFAYSRMRDAGQIVGGQISPDGRHTAQFIANIDTYQLRCAREPCSRGSTQACPVPKNPVRFLPLVPKPDGKEWSCSEAVTAVEASGSIGLGPPTQPDC
jgi:hypothetical protein